MPEISGLGHWVEEEFRSERRYRFELDRARMWAIISRPDTFRDWWPWLRSLRAAELAVGATWECEIQPRLPYPLRFTLEFQEVTAPHSIATTVSGDVRGTAGLTLVEEETCCLVRVESSLMPVGGRLRTLARVARPVASVGHAWVLDSAARRFAIRAGMQGTPTGSFQA